MYYYCCCFQNDTRECNYVTRRRIVEKINRSGIVRVSEFSERSFVIYLNVSYHCFDIEKKKYIYMDFCGLIDQFRYIFAVSSICYCTVHFPTNVFNRFV